MIKFKFISLFIGILMPGFLLAQQFQAAVSKSTLAVGEKFRIEFSVNSSGDQFEPPTFDGFRIISGPNQSTSMQFVNGKSSYSISYNYILMALREGDFTVRPARIKVGSNILESNEINLKVVKDNAAAANQGNSNTGGSQAKSGGNNETDQNLFIMASVSDASPFVGQQIVATYKLYFKYNIVGEEGVSRPNFNGFWTEELNLQNQRPVVEVYNGVQYSVYTLIKAILIPQRAGELTLEPYVTNLMVQQNRNRSIYDQFFGNALSTQVHVASRPVTVRVKQLPGNKPAGFTGAVGQFNIALSADHNQVKANDAINVKYVVSGAGNLKLLEEPKINFPTDFEVYDAKVDDNINVSENGISGKRSYNYLTIPRHKGTYTIEPVNFVYFDPKKEKFVTITTDPLEFIIDKGNDDASAAVTYSNTNKEEIKLLGSDIRFIKMNTILLDVGSSFFGSWRFYLLWFLPFPLFLILWFGRNKVAEKRNDAVYMKRSKANKMAEKRLSVAKKHKEAKEEHKFYEEVFKAMYGFIEHKLNIPAADLSKDRIRQALEQNGVHHELVSRYLSILDSCEMARFAPMSNMTMDGMYSEAVNVLSDLQKNLK